MEEPLAKAVRVGMKFHSSSHTSPARVRPSCRLIPAFLPMEYAEYIEEDIHAPLESQGASHKETIPREIIDSLPYIDAFDNAAQLEAQRLVDQEARTFRNTHPASAVTVSFSVRLYSPPPILPCMTLAFDLNDRLSVSALER